MFMFKFKNNLLPISCSHHVSLQVVNSNYQFRKVNDFASVRFISEIRRKSIAVMGPDLWNKLPQSLRELNSISSFKSHISQFFLSQYI
jgi:hypothetical protein